VSGICQEGHSEVMKFQNSEAFLLSLKNCSHLKTCALYTIWLKRTPDVIGPPDT